jgi:diguanylate cyclase (GGDEF)-like protein/PAS domain S-box-containing protein
MARPRQAPGEPAVTATPPPRSDQRGEPSPSAAAATLVDLLPEPALLIDAVGTVLRANEPVARLLGRTASELVGASALDHLHPEDRGTAIEALGTTAAEPGVHDPITLRIIVDRGSTRFVELIGHNLLDEPGVGAIVISARDLTDRARSEAELAALGRRFEVTFDHSPVGRALVTLDGRLTRVNPSMCEMLGMPPEQIVGRNVFEFSHPDDVAADRATGVSIARGDIEFSEDERRLLHSSGAWRWIRRTVCVIRDALGRPEYASFDVVDITEVRESADLQRRAEAQLRALLDATSEIITVLEADGRWRWSSGALGRVLGYDAERDPEPEGGVFAIVHRDDLALASQSFAELAAGSSRGDDKPLTVRLRAADGEWRWFEIRGRNLVDDPDVNGIVLLSRDVTELRSAQEQLSHQATHDSLTKLPNRVLFQELGEQALARADRDGTLIAVLFLDLDRFKRVNDTHGHPIGDALLVEVAHRLRVCVRRGDVVARFGGDEFVILCEHPAGQPEMLHLANRLIAAVSAPAELGTVNTEIGVSVGVAIGAGGRITVDTLLRDADAALYQAKEQGRGRAVLFGAPLGT